MVPGTIDNRDSACDQIGCKATIVVDYGITTAVHKDVESRAPGPAPSDAAKANQTFFAVGPPRPEVAVLIDAATGDCNALDPPPCPPGLPYPKPRDAPIRFRAEVMEPGGDFDQTGFELPAAPQIAPANSGQGELFGDEFSHSDAPEGEPVFWSASGGQAFRDDDFVQADAAERAWRLAA